MHDEGTSTSDYQVDGGVGGDFSDDYDETTSVDDGTLPVDRYLDRELSWLHFNQRVLELAEDPTVPLLERVNFLAIFASNLDEFFMVRVAGLKRRIVTGLAVPTNTGRVPADVLASINSFALELQHRHARAFLDLVKPALDEASIHVETWADLDDADRARVDEIFAEQIFPVLMPLAVDPAHPFPYISGLSLNLSVRVRNPKTAKIEFARLKVPTVLPRFVQLADSSSGNLRFLTLEDLISNHLHELFPGMEILEHHEFRVTRNEDVEIEEDETENLIQALERELLRRRFGPPIRLEITDDMDPVTLGLLVRELGITEQEVYRLPAPLDLGGLFELAKIDRPALKYPKHVPVTPVQLQPAEPNTAPDVFASIREGDILVHHPYESFATSVQAFLEQAAKDPNVLAIKQTLYRTSGDSPIVEALIDAAEAGKAVLALVEIKARFDEQNNIDWAPMLEMAGCTSLRARRGSRPLQTGVWSCCRARWLAGSYSHVGTGNYNPKTSRIYEDLGLFTRRAGRPRPHAALLRAPPATRSRRSTKRLLGSRPGICARPAQAIRTRRKERRAGKPSGIRLKLYWIVDEASSTRSTASMAGGADRSRRAGHLRSRAGSPRP